MIIKDPEDVALLNDCCQAAESCCDKIKVEDHLLEEEKNRLVRDHLLGKLICQVLEKDSQMSELVIKF